MIRLFGAMAVGGVMGAMGYNAFGSVKEFFIVAIPIILWLTVLYIIENKQGEK